MPRPVVALVHPDLGAECVVSPGLAVALRRRGWVSPDEIPAPKPRRTRRAPDPVAAPVDENPAPEGGDPTPQEED